MALALIVRLSDGAVGALVHCSDDGCLFFEFETGRTIFFACICTDQYVVLSVDEFASLGFSVESDFPKLLSIC